MNKVFHLAKQKKEVVRMPIKSNYDVLVKEGDEVEKGKAIFQYDERDILDTHYLPTEFNIDLTELINNRSEIIKRLDGEFVEKGTLLAEKASKNGITIKQIIAQAEGVVSFKRLEQGHLDVLSEKKERSFVSSFDGKVTEISLEKGIGVETDVVMLKTFTQKFWQKSVNESLKYGTLEVLGKGDSIYTKKDLSDDYVGKIVYVGYFVYADLVKEVFKRGASGVIAYSIDFDQWEQIDGNFALLGGFGQMTMPSQYLKLLRDFEDNYVYFDKDFGTRLRVVGVKANLVGIDDVESEYKDVEIDDYVISTEELSFGKIGQVKDFEDDGNDRQVLVSFSEKDNRLLDVRELQTLSL